MDCGMATESADSPARSDELDAKAVERLVFFSDAVIAIIITLMVLEVRLPQLPEHAGDAALRSALAALGPKYHAVLLSFCVIGLFWMVHHRRFNRVLRVDAGVVCVNLMFLLTIACVPFATAVMAEHGGLTSVLLYAGVLTAASLTSALLWWAVGRKSIVGQSPEALQEMRIATLMSLTSAAFFIASMGIAFLSTSVAQWSWFLVFGTNWIARELYTRYRPQ
jgi:uncharacterized membrane protein